MRAQAARNYHAMLAARALGCLAGLLPGAGQAGQGGRAGSAAAAAPCEPARAALRALLTPALAGCLADPDPRALLHDLNSSLLNPQVPDLVFLGTPLDKMTISRDVALRDRRCWST